MSIKKAFFAVFTTFFLTLTGCLDNSPDDQSVVSYFDQALALPYKHSLEVTGLNWDSKNDIWKTECSFTVTVKENIYTQGSLQQELEATKIDYSEASLLQYTAMKVASLSEPLRSKLQAKIPNEKVGNPYYVNLTAKSGSTYSGQATILAKKENFSWTFRIQIRKMQFPLPDTRSVLKQLPVNSMIIGKKSTEDYVRKAVKKSHDYADLVDRTLNNKKSQQIKNVQSLRNIFLSLLAKYQYFKIESVEETPSAVLHFSSVDSDTGKITGIMYTGVNKKLFLNGTISEEANNAILTLQTDKQHYNITLRSGKLYIHVPNSESELFLQPITFEQFSKLEYITIEENDPFANNSEVQTKSILPGTAWQGKFFCSSKSEKESIGVYFSDVDNANLTGYLFDPENMELRKPFIATLFQKKNSLPTLSLKTIKTQTISERKNTTQAQKNWLNANEEYELTFKQHDNIFEGQIESCNVVFSPMPEYEERTEKENNKTEAENITPGQAWSGQYVCLQKNTFKKFGLAITSKNATSFEGVFFDHDDLLEQDKITGSIAFSNNQDVSAQINITHNDNYSTNVKMAKIWQDIGKTLQLKLTKRGNLKGIQSNKCKVLLEPFLDFKKLVEEENLKKKQELMANTSFIYSGMTLKGKWRSSDSSSELGLVISSVSTNGTEFIANAFDPLEPSVTLNLAGKIIEDKGKKGFTLTPMKQPTKGKYLTQRNSTQYRLVDFGKSYHKWSLLNYNGTFHGHWYGAEVFLMPEAVYYEKQEQEKKAKAEQKENQKTSLQPEKNTTKKN